MEKYLKENFAIESKNPSEEALQKWRTAVKIVKNPSRRFRHVADLLKRKEVEAKRRKIQVAKENADVIILDDNFSTIENVVKWGRSVYINIQKFVQFQLTANIVALIVNFSSACVTGTAPLTAVQLLWVNMIMDTLGALALATEPPTDELMQRPPVGRDESFISRTMWRNITGQAAYQLIVLGALEFDGKQLLKLSGSDGDSLLNTFVFNSFVFCQKQIYQDILLYDFKGF